MPGFNRRAKPLKGVVAIGDFDDFSISNPADDDLLAYDLGTSTWVNTKSLTGDFSITGSLTVNSIVLSDGISLGSDIDATGDLDIGGNGEIDGSLTVGGIITGDSLVVTNNTVLGGTLGVTGTLTGSAFSFSGNGTVTGDLTVGGTLNTTGSLSFDDVAADDLTVSGTLNVTGGAAFQAGVAINSNLTAGAAAFTSTSVTGDMSLKGSISQDDYLLSASSPDVTLDLISNAGTLTVSGRQADGTAVDMLVFDPDHGLTLSNGFLSIGASAGELTIATGAVTATGSFHTIDTEADAATDDLDTISGGTTGDILIIGAADSARDVVAKDATGNLSLNGDFTMDHVDDRLVLLFDGTNWVELSRSDNAT